jgi:hypothetical protein
LAIINSITIILSLLFTIPFILSYGIFLESFQATLIFTTS